MIDETRRSGWLTLFLLVLITVLLVANLAMTVVHWKQGKSATPAVTRSLPCEAVPVRFILDEPECADKLLRAMNVTNVRVIARNSS